MIGQLVPGLAAAVGEAARYVRSLPGWDDTQTLGQDLRELGPLARFLGNTRAHEDVSLLEAYLDCCVNFELSRRKAFFVDGPVAWLLARTDLDIEGRVLRLPFPCFAPGIHRSRYPRAGGGSAAAEGGPSNHDRVRPAHPGAPGCDRPASEPRRR
jgi:hypothetical protein